MKKVIIIFSILVFFVTVQFAYAQSGRIIENPAQEITVLDQLAEKYPTCERGLEAVIYIAPVKVEKFVEKINNLGNCGYRLEAVNKLCVCGRATGNVEFYGVVKLDAENKFEYQWFAGQSEGEVETKANELAKEGFYFRKSMMFFRYRDYTDSEKEEREKSVVVDLGLDNFPGSGAMYFFERKNGVKTKKEYQMIRGSDARSDKALARNIVELNKIAAEGFRPVGIFYGGAFTVFRVLMEKNPDVKSEGEYTMVRYNFNSSKLFTKLAQQGYRLMFVGSYFAILHRTRDEALPIRYESTDNFNGMIKKLPQLNGARYEARGIDIYHVDYDFSEVKPFFAVPTGNDSTRYEYKFLDMTNFNERYFKQKDKSANLNDPPTKEMLAEFQKLVNEGYTIRDVYSVGEITVIFEREIKSREIMF